MNKGSATGWAGIEERSRRHHHIVPAVAGKQFRLQNLIGVKDFVVDLDTGLFLELGEGIPADIVGQVVDIQDLFFAGHCAYGTAATARVEMNFLSMMDSSI
jgi:hypothetical protein